VRGLDSEQFSQKICCLRTRGLFYAPLETAGYSVCFLGKTRALDVAAMVRLRRLVRTFSPDIIHAHDFTSHLLVYLATRFCKRRVRIVATLHGGHARLTGFKLWAYLALLRRSNRVVCVAQRQMPTLETQLGPSTTPVHIPYGVRVAPLLESQEVLAARTQLDIPADASVVVMVARYEHPKDQDSLLAAAQQLTQRFSQCRFVLVGDGSRRKTIAAKVDACGLSSAFCFVRDTTDVGGILATANVCVLPSFHEGLPICILEYMAAGKPVVASDVGGVRELIRDGEDGFLTEAGDADALASRIALLLEDADRAAGMGRSARSRAEQCFSLEGMLAAYRNLYRAVQ
jgi:glycosyltransferase involved in cell wall biosynthesis